ncbi:MAG TPA: hypothetical protein VGJ82_05540 [Thermoanaerobaculia bacterium]
MNDLFEQSLSLAGDVLFLRTADGVEIKGSRGAVSLRGRDIYPLLERLAPHLRGERPLRPMLAALPESKRDAVTKLCALLHERGFLRPSGPIEPITQYAAHFGRGAAAFREARFFVRGTSPARRGICHALIELGARRLEVDGERDARIEQYAAGRAEVSFCAATERDEVCVASFVLPITRRGRWSMVGPLSGDGVASCTACAHAALGEREAEIAAQPGWSIEIGGPLPPATASLIGNVVALELFRAVTGAGALRLDRRLALINAATLELALLRYACGCAGRAA